MIRDDIKERFFVCTNSFGDDVVLESRKNTNVVYLEDLEQFILSLIRGIVPEEREIIVTGIYGEDSGNIHKGGFNACRDIILKELGGKE